MKRLAIVAVLALTAVAAYAYEDPSKGGALVSAGTSVSNTTTAAPFSISAGARYAVQCSAAACLAVCHPGSCTATCTLGAANTGVLLAQGQLFDVPLDSTVTGFAMVPVSGAASCQVFQVLP